ncbi:MAG: hypothetical protein ACPGVB_02940 [Chitinophagales bacterium]
MATFEKMKNKIDSNPKKLFLIDGLGALLSAFLLGVVLVRFENYFGVPTKELYILSFLACIFAVYDFVCYFGVGEGWRLFLRAIAIINISYCCLTAVLLFYHYQSITNLGFVYFLIEMVIVIGIAIVELKIASGVINKKTQQFN